MHGSSVPKRRPDARVAKVLAKPKPRIAAAMGATQSRPAERQAAAERHVAGLPVATGQADPEPHVAAVTVTSEPHLGDRQQELEGAVRPDDQDLFVPAGSDWTTYHNARFGTTVAFPDRLFEILPISENGGGRQFTTAAGDARLEIYAWENVEGVTPQALQLRLVDAAGYGRVIYRSVGRNWLVLSGLRSGKVFYEKYLFDAASDTVHSFTVEYPRSRKDIFNPVVDRMENSLHVGAPPADPEERFVPTDKGALRSRLAENRAAAERYVARRRAAAERSAARDRPSILFAGKGLP